MKKTIFIFAAAILILFTTGCASSGKAIIEQRDPIALVSLVSNRDINWKGEESTNSNAFSILGNRTLREDPDMTLASNADDLINAAEALFRATLDASPLINLADRGTVLSSRAYQEAKSRVDQLRQKNIKPSDYGFINSRDRNFPASLSGETGIQRSMFVEFDFTKAMYGGIGKNGDGRAELEMTILILDSSGKALYNKKYSTWSSSTMKVSGGVYSQTELMELFEEAITSACNMFLYQLEN